MVAVEQAEPPPGIAPLTPDSVASAPADSPTDADGAESVGADGPTEPASAIVTVQNRSVNVRSGPGIDFEAVAGAAAGDTFTTTGKTEGGWWRVCCLPGSADADGEGRRAWISARVVAPNATAEALPPLTPLFPDDLTAAWNVEYECGSERCAVAECTAVVAAEVRNSQDPRWLEINRSVTWADACGENSTWLHQVDRIDGAERYENSTGLFLFNYWTGANPAGANVRFQLDSGEEVAAWCSDEQTAEVEEEGGWTTVYEGTTCYDTRTGMLVSMQYTKRWLFSGEFEGERYARAYFGDFEMYKVKLESTNAELALIFQGAADSAEDPAAEESASETPTAEEGDAPTADGTATPTAADE